MSSTFKQPLINLRKLYNDFMCHTHPDKFIGKNYIINPTFEINQRAFAGGVFPVNSFGWDHWTASTSGTNATVSGTTLTIVSGEVQNALEFSQGVAGKQFTLSWEGSAKCSLFYVNGGARSPQKSPITFTTTETANGGSNAISELCLFTVGTVTNPKLELGSTATPFEYPDVGSELVKCQRYYQKSYAQNIATSAITQLGSMLLLAPTSGVNGAGYNLKQTMRDLPTIVSYSGTTGASGVWGTSSEGDISANVGNVNDSGFWNWASFTIAPNGHFQYTADAEL